MDAAPEPLPIAKRRHTEVLKILNDPHEPIQIGPYRIISVVARGGMGTVYRARVIASCAVPIGEEVALKLLRSFGSREDRLRFTRESGYLQSLRHPGIVRVLDAGDHDGQPYLVMPLLDGMTVQQLMLDQGQLSEPETAEIAIQALEALYTAHLAGILHRDVKPGNIMLTDDGSVKVVDFGLAHRLDGHSNLTATGAVVGTPAYMSPEQAAGERLEVGPRSDVYAIGACCYEMVTGRQPFEAENPVALLRAVTDQPLIPPKHLRPLIHPDLETIILKAMAKHPGDRYASAEAMAADLRHFRQGAPITTKRPGPWRQWRRSAWRHRRWISLLCLFIFIGFGALTLGIRAYIRNQHNTVATGPLSDPSANWVDETTIDYPDELTWKAYTPLGRAMQLTTIGSVVGSVRLHCDITIKSPNVRAEILLCDRDIGRGYRLRLEQNTDTTAQMMVLRDDKVVTSRTLPEFTIGRTLNIRFERHDDMVTAEIAGHPPVTFVDLAPIEGPDADAVHLAMDADCVEFSHVKLERQRTGLYVSALAPADSLRQDGRFSRAIDAYTSFLRDNPESTQTRDARFRIGLCHEALHDDEQALQSYVDVARLYSDQAHYVMAARFRAWGCCIRLGNYAEAEQYFIAIRQSRDLPTLLASVPEDTINQVIADYATRGLALADSEPMRAYAMYETGADLAAYLDVDHQVQTLRCAMADTALGMGKPQMALAALRPLPADSPYRLLREGHTYRLLHRPKLAFEKYTAIVMQSAHELPAQWARFWAADLALSDEGVEAAEMWWSSSRNPQDLPGRLMRHLQIGSRPMSLPETDQAVVEYTNARLAWRKGLDQQYRDRLLTTTSLAPSNVWPVPLARALLSEHE